MKVLSLTQPWAQLVVEGHKRFETRSWSSPYRGPLAIHASKGFPRWAQELLDEGTPFADALNRPVEELPRGAIVGVVMLTRIRPTWVDDPGLLSPESAFGDWGPGRYAWKLEEPVMFWPPIPAKGALGLWKPSHELWAAIMSQARAKQTGVDCQYAT